MNTLSYLKLNSLSRYLMPFYVYIIQSHIDKSYYKGSSEDPLRRLMQHNNSESRYTSAKIPWKIVYAEICADKREALIREKAMKKYGHERIEKLINSAKNIVTSLE